MKILVFAEEGVGNFIEKTSMLASLKKNLPQAQVDVLVDPRAFGVAQGHPHINKLYKWPNLPKERYDYGLVTVFSSNAFQSAYHLCNKIIKHPNVTFISKSESLHNLEIAKIIGGWDGKYYPASIFIPEEDKAWAEQTLRSFVCKKDPSPIIGLCFGCECSIATVHRKRLWITSRWVDLVHQLYEKHKPNFVLLGTKSEEKETQEFLSKLNKQVSLLNLFGKTNMKQAAAIIKACDLFLCLDSGLQHVAAAVGTKFVSIWGPTSEVKSQPWCDAKNYILIKDDSLSCRPCYTKNPAMFQKCKRQLCLENITPKIIIDAIETKGWLK